MTPGTITVPIFKGAAWEHTLSLKQSGTETPVDLTGLTPFVMSFKNASGSLLANATVTIATPSSGVVVVALTAAQTATFPLGENTVTVGMRNAYNRPYIQGTLSVKFFTPDPAVL